MDHLWEFKRLLTSIGVVSLPFEPLWAVSVFSARAKHWEHVAPERKYLAQAERRNGKIAATIIFVIIFALLVAFGVFPDD